MYLYVYIYIYICIQMYIYMCISIHSEYEELSIAMLDYKKQWLIVGLYWGYSGNIMRIQSGCEGIYIYIYKIGTMHSIH